ncbi:hypothetical protein GFY24_27325 [Nocardia sp. SYP-A9097]|uniref:hypothetical protein n=1 Tax=Nocardia sp. SYP-A9097 TaxID=2663237 RepID=UPI00129A694D|nr:hypothetical protein [Nocardia sp. SYP-A9097]MRH91107.1 hypothetical protein [Nocardia sp. SYP-A9097]
MDGSNAGADRRGATPRRRLPAPVAGAAAAVGAVSLGLVLIGACGLGGQDTYVAPPPLNADLQAAPVVSQSGGSTTPAVVIPPSPTWRVAADQPPRHSPIPTVTTDPKDASPDPEAPTTASRTTPLRPTTTSPSTTRPRPTTDSPAPTTESTRPTTPPTTEPAIAVPTTEDDQPASG